MEKIFGPNGFNLRQQYEFDRTEGDSGPRIGGNVAFVKLKQQTDKFLGLLEAYQDEVQRTANDRNLSLEGKRDRQSKSIERFRRETAPLMENTQAQIEALKAEADALRNKVRGKFRPADVGDRMEAAETRGLLRAMPTEERSRVLIEGATRRDPSILRAVADIPEWDRSILGSPNMRHTIADAIEEAELQDLSPVERAGVSNAIKAAELAARKLAAFASEGEAIAKKARDLNIGGGFA